MILVVSLSVFKHGQLFNPAKVVDRQPSEFDSFCISDSIIDYLKIEIPKYITVAEDVSPSVNLLVLWKTHADDLPCDILLIQSSLAAAEMFFQFQV